MCSTHTNQKIRREKPKVRTLSEKAKKRVPPIRRALKAQKRSLSLLFSVSLFLVLLPVCFFFFFFFLLRVSKSTKDKKTPFFFCHVAHPKKREIFQKAPLSSEKKVHIMLRKLLSSSPARRRLFASSSSSTTTTTTCANKTSNNKKKSDKTKTEQPCSALVIIADAAHGLGEF